MSIQKYQALLKTAELGNITRAAEQMGYTQPAVSKMISDLEAEWGVTLLQRNKSGIQVTSATKYLLPILKAISEDCAELEYCIGELRGQRTGLVRVAAFASVVDNCIPQIIRRFQSSYPDINIDLRISENYLEIENWIMKGEVDCGFVSAPTTYDLDLSFYKQDELIAVLPADHPLAEASYFPVAQLEREPSIILKEVVDFEVMHFLDQLSGEVKPHYLVNGDHTILAMIEAGLGISVMHSMIMESDRYRVVWKPFDIHQYRSICIATQNSRRVPSLVRLFIKSAIGAPAAADAPPDSMREKRKAL